MERPRLGRCSAARCRVTLRNATRSVMSARGSPLWLAPCCFGGNKIKGMCGCVTPRHPAGTGSLVASSARGIVRVFTLSWLSHRARADGDAVWAACSRRMTAKRGVSAAERGVGGSGGIFVSFLDYSCGFFCVLSPRGERSGYKVRHEKMSALCARSECCSWPSGYAVMISVCNSHSAMT